jgi:hypothetical protein
MVAMARNGILTADGVCDSDAQQQNRKKEKD